MKHRNQPKHYRKGDNLVNDFITHKPIPTSEQETTVSYLRSDDYALVYSSIPSDIKKLLSLISYHPDQCILEQRTLLDSQLVAISAKVPKKLISIHKPRKPSTLTPEQLQQSKEHGRKLASLKKAKKENKE